MVSINVRRPHDWDWIERMIHTYVPLAHIDFTPDEGRSIKLSFEGSSEHWIAEKIVKEAGLTPCA